MNRRFIRSVILATTCIAGLPATAMAQAAASKVQEPDNGEETIIVTGSRVITNGNDAPTPTTVVTTQQLDSLTPSNIPDGLNKLPVFTGSNNQQNAGQGGQTSNTVGNFLALRGMGSQRTLVLFDGNRVQPSSTAGSVDVNTLPQLLLQRVDVVTGGVSAVYGTEGIAGVVNFIVDKKFKGVKVEASSGISNFGDVPSKRFGVAVGTDIGERGHFIASFEHYDVGGITSNLARPASAAFYTLTGGGTTANPFTVTSNSRSTWINPWGNPGIFGGALSGYKFGAGGALVPFVHGTATTGAFVEQGGDGGYIDPAPILAKLTNNKGYARFDYDLADDVNFHVDGIYSQSKNSNTLTPFLYIFKFIPSTNAYLPNAAKTLLNNSGESGFVFAKATSNGRPLSIEAKTRSIYGSTGLSAKLFGGLNFDVNYAHGETRMILTTYNNENNFRMNAALDSIVNGSGQIVCRDTVNFPGCVPLNPFGPNSESAAAFAYIDGTTSTRLTNTMDDVTASISGTLFNLGAGPAKFAVTGEYRAQSLTNVSTDQPGTGEWMSNVTADAHGSENNKEFALEVEVPLLAGSSLAKSLSFNGAVRYADYSISGTSWTWKAGLVWGLTDSLTLRATRSRDYRAPTLMDLFQPVSVNRTGYSDLLTGVDAVTDIQSQGNRNLKAEVANTLTIGAVFKPESSGFSVSVDYYKIKIANAISIISGADASVQAQCNASNGTSPLCSLYVRPLGPTNTSAANYPTRILTQGLNIAGLTIEGVDFEMNYAHDFGSDRLNLRGLVSYQPTFKEQQAPGFPVINSAGAIGGAGSVAGSNVHPKWRVTAMAGYDFGPYSVNIQERWRSSLKYSGDTTLVYNIKPVSSVAYTDLTLAANIETGGAKGQLYLSVQNLFNKSAPIYASTSIPGYAYPAVSGDDIIGRYFTVGLRAKF